MVDSGRISARAVIEACTSASERIRTLITEKTYRRALSDKEIANRDAYLAAIRAFSQEVQSLGEDRPTIARISQGIVALLPYPGGLVLEELFAGAKAEQRLSLCRNILSQPVGGRRDKVVFGCFDELEKLGTSKALAVLAWCVKNRIEARTAAEVLMKALGFPAVGEAADISAELSQDFSDEKAGRFLRLLGIDAADRKRHPKRASAFRGKAHTDLGAILANPEKVSAINLSRQKIRRFPDELRRCVNLRYLNIDDDYFDDDEMKRIETLLPNVELKWTRGLYIDGKHGR